MLKKKYVTPVAEAIEIEVHVLSTSRETTKVGTGSGTAGNGPDLSNDRRGTWGNIWE